MPRGQLGFFTVDPATGKITYVFRGRIEAEGIDLPQTPSGLISDPPAPEYSLRFLDPTGTVTGSLMDGAGAVNSTVVLKARRLAGLRQAAIELSAGNTDGLTSVNLRATGTSLGSISRVLTNALGESNFLQLAAIANRKLAFGSFGFTWNGTNEMTFLVSHGMGLQPIVALATQANNNTQDLLRVFPGSPGGTSQFTINVLANANYGGGGGGVPAAGTADNIQWIAIG